MKWPVLTIETASDLSSGNQQLSGYRLGGWWHGLSVMGLSLVALLFAALPVFSQPGSIASGPASEAASGASETCEFFSTTQRYNTQTNGDVIVIGAQAGRRYRVIVVGQRENELAAIRACVVDAFMTTSSLGSYIHVGSFGSRSDAESIRRVLVRAGYPARIVYVR